MRRSLRFSLCVPEARQTIRRCESRVTTPAGRGIICTDMTYHGNTTAVDEISPLFRQGRSTTPNVRTIPFPDSYRPRGGLEGAALAEAYAAEVSRAIEGFRRDGVPFAGMLVCPIFANEGLPDVPPGFVEMAAARVREAGGLLIADEVQAGFGRTGRMWGHEWTGVVPDIVTLGKPMGNGHPLAAVVARSELIDAFRAEVFYFNTFGGQPGFVCRPERRSSTLWSASS